MLFENENLIVRELMFEDNLLLAKWLSDPQVLAFYEGRDNPFDLERVNKKFYNRENETIRCMIEYDGAKIGYIQFYLLDEETSKQYGYSLNSETIYGIDQFIGEHEYWNKGIGTLLVSSMVQYLINIKNADKVVMDPQSRNERALRCYEKCGFKRVKLLPNHELHEGERRDCWLLEYNKAEN